LQEKLKPLSDIEREYIAEQFQSVFQRWRAIERIVVPNISEFVEVLLKKDPVVYKGVSYNPLIGTLGENVNLVDFFGWAKASEMKSVILNASVYAIINESQTSPVERFSENAGKEAIDFMREQLKSFPTIEQISNKRDNYLRAIALSLFPPSEQPMVVDSRNMFQSRRYPECLQEAISFCAENPKNGEVIQFKKYANYIRYNTPYQRWYSAFVLAEALYLYRAFGVNIKLGPTTESNFDSLIRDFMKQKGIPYGFVWYDRSIEKQVPYTNALTFDDGLDAISQKMSNETVRQWVYELVQPFEQFQSLDIQTAIEMLIATVRENSLKPIPKLNAEGEWFLTFPPGACD